MASMILPLLVGLAVALATAAYAGETALGPRDASRLSASMTADGVHLEREIAPGRVLLTDELRIISDTPGIELGAPLLPAGEWMEHPRLGAIRVFRGHVAFELPIVIEDVAPPSVDLRVTSVECAESGDCSPPRSERVRVEPGTRAASPSGTMTPTEGTLDADSPQSLSWLGLGSEAGGQAGPTFLQPDAAFILSVELEDPHTIVVRWQIADTYYLYRDRFGFALRDTPGLALGEARVPPGKEKLDPYFGEVEVFYGEAWAAIPIAPGVPALSELTLDVTYQGCADLGLCYPPITKTVTVVAPPDSD